MPRLLASYSFHPVGQGLFVSGALVYRSGRERAFHWVYDCGSSSSQALVTAALDQLRTSVATGREGKPVLDLVAVSHFDADHISGLTSLLARFRVHTLLLPYMPLWQRMTQLVGARSYVSQGARGFFIDPVGYVAALPGAEVDEIVLVPASGPDGRPEGDADAPPPDDNFPWRLAFDSEEVAGDDVRLDRGRATQARGPSSPQVRLLKPGGALRAAGLWEFVPYNDESLALQPNDAFKLAVEEARERLLSEDTPSLRNDALKALKRIYDRQFGSSAKCRNVISLFLYTGPIAGKLHRWERTFGSLAGAALFKPPRQSEMHMWFLLHHPFPWRSHWQEGAKYGGVLLTGDGYLDTSLRLDHLTSYLGAAQVAGLACLQVMHHGAKGNWYRGVAAAIHPGCSIFSSDPAHRGLRHPHREVWDDFAPYHPFQVDRLRGFSLDSAHWHW